MEQTVKKQIAIALAALGCALAGTAAEAASNVYWSVGINAPPVGTVISNAPAYAPAPVYYAPPPPAYVQEPVYYAPPPPRVVYRPVPVVVQGPAYYPPAPVVYAGGYYRTGYRHHGGWHEHEWRDRRWDGDRGGRGDDRSRRRH
ncbi:MAG: hypothetical protein JF606_09615 [Burkholderiales bacterium]|nr:hypothetical protein [Burkholderiales bacterium]